MRCLVVEAICIFEVMYQKMIHCRLYSSSLASWFPTLLGKACFHGFQWSSFRLTFSSRHVSAHRSILYLVQLGCRRGSGSRIWYALFVLLFILVTCLCIEAFCILYLACRRCSGSRRWYAVSCYAVDYDTLPSVFQQFSFTISHINGNLVFLQILRILDFHYPSLPFHRKRSWKLTDCKAAFLSYFPSHHLAVHRSILCLVH